MQKRAATTLLEFLLGLLIAGVAIVVILNVGEEIYGLLGFEKDDKGYFDTFIKAAESKENSQIIYYVSGEHFLVGFDKDTEEVNPGFSGNIKKPKLECGIEACICLCNLDSGDATPYGCLSKARCRQFKNIKGINGIVLTNSNIKDAKQGKLLIKGKIELPLNVKTQDNVLEISLP